MNKLKSNTEQKKYIYFKPTDIKPKDDAFHGSLNFLDIEWWYFDAVLEGGYSLHVGIRTFHIKKQGIVKSRIEVYKNGKILVEAVKTDPFNKFHISDEIPLIELDGKRIMELNLEKYKKTGEWSYNITLKIENHAVDLTFTGSTRGWKIETSNYNSWAVALPKAKVSGTMTIDGRSIPVNGIGYHDHNWDYSVVTALKNIGWLWGRIIGDTLNVVWAKTLITREKHNLLAVINQDGNENKYFSINPNNIVFIPRKFVKKNGRWIPMNFVFKMKDSICNTPIDIDIYMETLDIHHSRIFTAHYWRYHVKTDGYITLGSKTEKIVNKTQIIEFLSFKSHGKKI